MRAVRRRAVNLVTTPAGFAIRCFFLYSARILDASVTDLNFLVRRSSGIDESWALSCGKNSTNTCHLGMCVFWWSVRIPEGLCKCRTRKKRCLLLFQTNVGSFESDCSIPGKRNGIDSECITSGKVAFSTTHFLQGTHFLRARVLCFDNGRNWEVWIGHRSESFQLREFRTTGDVAFFYEPNEIPNFRVNISLGFRFCGSAWFTRHHASIGYLILMAIKLWSYMPKERRSPIFVVETKISRQSLRENCEAFQKPWIESHMQLIQRNTLAKLTSYISQDNPRTNFIFFGVCRRRSWQCRWQCGQSNNLALDHLEWTECGFRACHIASQVIWSSSVYLCKWIQTSFWWSWDL